MTAIETIYTTVGVVTGILSIIGTIIAATKKFRDKKTAELLRDTIKPLVDPIQEKVDSIGQQVNDNERDRLRGVILTTASRLRAGDIVTEEEYKDCIYCHDKYVSLGGNGQVKEAFKLIEEHFHQLQAKEIHDNQENR